MYLKTSDLSYLAFTLMKDAAFNEEAFDKKAGRYDVENLSWLVWLDNQRY